MDLPVPDTLFDDHADNSSAAARSEMSIAEHMYLFYDLFVPPVEGADPKKGGSLDASGQRNLDRMTPAQRALWDAALRPPQRRLPARPISRARISFAGSTSAT